MFPSQYCNYKHGWTKKEIYRLVLLVTIRSSINHWYMYLRKGHLCFSMLVKLRNGYLWKNTFGWNDEVTVTFVRWVSEFSFFPNWSIRLFASVEMNSCFNNTRCGRHGTCRNLVAHYVCHCGYMFTGEHCERCKCLSARRRVSTSLFGLLQLTVQECQSSQSMCT